MVWIVFHHNEYSSCESPTFFGAFYSEAGARECLKILVAAPNANLDEYHIVSIPVRTLA